MILIHGAWAGRWVWQRITPYLALRGWQVHAVDLPGNGSDDTPPEKVSLERYVKSVARRFDEFDGPAVLVAHSGGGVVASQLAEDYRARVACVIYVAGIMLADGAQFAGLVRELAQTHPQARGIGPHLEWSLDRMLSRVPVAAARQFFFHDCPPALAETAAAQLTAQPEAGRAVTPRLSAANYGTVPRAYIEAERDRAIVPAMQELMQRRSPGAVRYSIDSGHAPQLASPGPLADLIFEAIAQLVPRATRSLRSVS